MIGKDMDKSHMISLKMKPMKMEKPTVSSKEEDRYPTVYIDDIKLPLSEEDLNEKGTAEIEYKLKRISESETNGKKHQSYELCIMGINIK